MTRDRLPDRRASLALTFAHAYPGAGPRLFTATVGFHPDGRIGEAFVHAVDGAAKTVNVDAHDAAIALSFALQHGAKLDALGRAMLRGADGKPHGFMGALIDALIDAFGPPPDDAAAIAQNADASPSELSAKLK